MNDLRTAAQQALEALEIGDPWSPTTLRVLKALRTALEQPEQLSQRTGDCLLTGVCAAEGHKISVQRKPLSDEEIDKLPWEPHEGNPMTFAEGLRYFARAIEAAHNIKEEE